jgi:hypothetical protein
MEKSEIGSGAMGFLVGVGLSFIFIGAWAWSDGKDTVREEAIRRGCGHWVVVGDKKVEFEWLHPVLPTKSEGH